MIYLDNASTTKMAKTVMQAMIDSFDESFANPSSLHQLGFESEKMIRRTRQLLAKRLDIKANQIFFVPSGTIANNAVIQQHLKKGEDILISELEHASIDSLQLKYPEQIKKIKVNKFGFVDLDDLKKKITAKTGLVSIIHVQNELASIQDIQGLAQEVKRINPKIKFHSDGVQAFDKIDISLELIDYYTISAHKINGPKGIAALYIREPKQFEAFYQGGGQEAGLFSGTENTYAIAGFESALTLKKNKEIKKLNSFIREELGKIEGVHILSPLENASPYILSVGIEGIGAEILLHFLEMEDIYISTGSACAKGQESRVLKAIGIDDKLIEGAIRLSFDRYTNQDELEKFIDILKNKVEIIRGMIR